MISRQYQQSNRELHCNIRGKYDICVYYKVLTIPGGAGFLPSTVSFTSITALVIHRQLFAF